MNAEKDLLRALIDLRDRQIQKARIQFSNRLSAIENGTDQASILQRETLNRYYNDLVLMETSLNKDIRKLLRLYKIYPVLSSIRGIGPVLAAKLIALIDIEKCDTVSALWRFAGLGVVDGAAEKLKAGEKAHFSRRLKSVMYLVGKSFLTSRSPYYYYYLEMKEKYERTHPEWTANHRHFAALRKAEKLFLSHLWEKWRKMENLPVRRAYVIDVLGHTNVRTPEEFGWP